MTTLSRIAASLLIVGTLAAIAFYLTSPLGSSMAFADVLQQVRELRSARFTGTITLTAPGQPARTTTTDTIVAEPARMRITMQGDPGTRMITIVDYQAHKMLMLNVERKQAELWDLTDFPARKVSPNPLEDLKNMHDKDGVSIGDKVIGGRRAKGFKVVTGGRETTIWADADTHLPVQIDMHTQTGDSPSVTVTTTNFRWDRTVDESLFSLTPPAGYEIKTRQMNMTTLKEKDKEKDLINALKSMAELNDGVYPEGFDTASLMKALQKSREPLLKKQDLDVNSPAWKQLLQRQVQAQVAIIHGFGFLSTPTYVQDWYYAGMNVEAGKAGVPILWYRPTGSATYRVIDADLKVHDTAPNDLPTVPSIPGKRPSTTPATRP
jgi:outer membrane lipoprotein-sorting protein